MSEWVDFSRVKAHARIADVIRRYGVLLQAVSPGCLRGRCPLPTHSSKDSALSFSINTARNVWACHSQSCIRMRGGAIGGNILDFVAVMEGCSIRSAALLLQGWFDVAAPSPNSGTELINELVAVQGNRVLGFTLHGLDASHEYLAGRGISPVTARMFGIGYYAGRGFLSGRMVIPIHNQAGALIAYAGRSVSGESPKYRLPPAFRKSAELFNLHRAAQGRSSRVVIVEGFFDCMNVHQAGFPNVVALMGCSMSMQQAGLLTQHFVEAILLLDGDAAGERATAKIAAALTDVMEVRCGHVPAGRQPDQLTDDELQRIIEAAGHNP
jgi:DNA primase